MATKKSKGKSKAKKTLGVKARKARRSVGGLKTYAKKMVGKRFDNLTIDRFIVPEGQTKKAALAMAKKIAQVPWSGKKGTVMFYGTARTTDGLMTKEDKVTFTNPFRAGKSFATVRRLGSIFKYKGKRWIVTKTKNGKKIARRWANKIRR